MAIAAETIPADRTTLSAGAGLSTRVAKFPYVVLALDCLPSFSEKCAMVIIPV
jgi:hypothetical protein